ncbi:ubiquinol-cytochrome c reductase iron-sulfur subunit [Kiritimatiellota bacterium B12222]|nr:ubiquinol-cytochrome c reductase iron-sulfur subunit [Kiritimatiellota bacterium B12222]
MPKNPFPLPQKKRSSQSTAPENSDAARVPTSGIDRRTFLTWLSGGVISAGTLLTMGTGALRLLVPNVHYGESTRMILDSPEHYPMGITYLEEHQVYLLRKGDTFRAMSGLCTHLGCSVNLSASGREFLCPCHGSRFDQQGQVLRGPASRPLPWLGMALTVDGRLVVDRSREVSESESLRV